MLVRYAAQGLLDLMAALSLAAAAPRLARLGQGSPLRARLGFTFGGLALFFAMRSAFEALGWPWLGLSVRLVVCVLPLAALVLAEGVLRRHAPRSIKALVTLGGLLTAVALLVARRGEPASRLGLGGFVLVSLLAVTALLLWRDRTSLSPQENLSVDTLVAVAVLFAALSASDFMPSAPVGLSGLGALLLAYVSEAQPGSRREGRRLAADLVGMVLLSAAGAAAFAGPLATGAAVEKVRLAVLLLGLLLTAASVAGVFRERGETTLLQFGQALAGADTASLSSFLQDLAGEPLLSGLRLTQGEALADYDTGALGRLMAAHAIWTREALGGKDAVRPCEELADLMARTEATHAMLISREPLRIALLTLPKLGDATGLETYLTLFRKLGAIAAERAA